MSGSWPEISRSARAMSRSRLMPGKTRTADFIWRRNLAQHFDPVILNDSIGEQFVGGVLQRRFGLSLVGARQFDVEHLALPHAGYAVDTERFQRALDGLALRIEDAVLQCDGDACLHVMLSPS